MVMEHHVGVVGRICSKKPFTQPAANRNHQRGQDDEHIAQNPQHANAGAFALGFGGLDRNVPGRSSSRPLVAKRLRSPDVAIDIPARAREAAKVHLHFAPRKSRIT